MRITLRNRSWRRLSAWSVLSPRCPARTWRSNAVPWLRWRPGMGFLPLNARAGQFNRSVWSACRGAPGRAARRQDTRHPLAPGHRPCPPESPPHDRHRRMLARSPARCQSCAAGPTGFRHCLCRPARRGRARRPREPAREVGRLRAIPGTACPALLRDAVAKLSASPAATAGHRNRQGNVPAGSSRAAAPAGGRAPLHCLAGCCPAAGRGRSGPPGDRRRQERATAPRVPGASTRARPAPVAAVTDLPRPAGDRRP